MSTFAVVTPTIGKPELEACINSVKDQDCVHYIIVDGTQYNAAVNRILMRTGLTNKIKMIWLGQNIGAGGWYGHRAYAACSFLVNEDVICYLDEDNYVEPNFIEAYRRIMTKPDTWAFTLRNIVTEKGEFLCQDNCESLGPQYPIAGTQDQHHIDTSCFAIPRHIAVRIGHTWYGQYAADRQFFHNLKHFYTEMRCTKQHTVNYRLGASETSPKLEFFTRGNQYIFSQFGEQLPWHK
jgi:hypothetical protein